MRSVNRGEEPATLKRNSKRWTQDLLEARKKKDKDAIRTAEGKYNKPKIREALKDMYGDLCCYCESTVSVTGFGRIEHRKPKKKYPKDAFNWDNLHWACERCNKVKSDKWDVDNPILDPTTDTDIIPTHIVIVDDELDTIEFRHKTGFGKTTIEHACLNRPELARARRKIYNDARKLKNELEVAEKSLDDMQIREIKCEINDMKEGKYSSCVKMVFGQY